MKLKSLFAIIIMLAAVSVNGQTYLSKTFLKKYDKAYFFQQFSLFVNYDVSLYRITYTTKDTKGIETVVSGLVCLPDVKTQGYPIVVYHHGTVGSRDEVPSFLSFENILPSIYCALGFIAIAPDYLGLGVNEGVHPYVHAASEASTSRDMAIATLEFLKEVGFNSTKDLFISGYSQGGHAGMALHRLLEEDANGFDLKAAAHMSGPYSISTGMKELLLSEKSYNIPAYMINVALAYDLVYNIFPEGDINKFFKPAYAKMATKFLNNEYNLWEMNQEILDSLTVQFGKAQPKLMLLESVLTEILNDENHIVNVALRDNDVYDWKPDIPTVLLYCMKDDQVSFQNSLIAEAKMKANGASNVRAIDVDSESDHSECVSPAVTQSIFFFLQYQLLSASKDIHADQSYKIYPNPAVDKIFFESKVEIKTASCLDAAGRSFGLKVDDNVIDVSELKANNYILILKDAAGKSMYAKFSKI